MPSEIYRSSAGSEVTVSGKHMGIVAIDFDWFEEDGCIEADAEFDRSDPKDPAIIATCECCGTQRVRVKIDPLDSLAS